MTHFLLQNSHPMDHGSAMLDINVALKMLCWQALQLLLMWGSD
jgi:hypothetical protein